MATLKPNADQIREILTVELAATGFELVKYEGRRCYFWVKANGVLRLSYLYKNIAADQVVRIVRDDIRESFTNCPAIG